MIINMFPYTHEIVIIFEVFKIMLVCKLFLIKTRKFTYFCINAIIRGFEICYKDGIVYHYKFYKNEICVLLILLKMNS